MKSSCSGISEYRSVTGVNLDTSMYQTGEKYINLELEKEVSK
ncbi:TPA_asm: hypothetical protein vir521_00012 [Caudoviricetes sp. vir521]|nr:TPA_asm: hypothetical protein vir521_00012 [Caudoviricetes sp. vir521]